MSLGRGYPIAAEALDLELYVLAALVAGSRDMHRRAGRSTALRQLRLTFELSEVSRRLIAVAVALRSALDASRRTAESRGAAGKVGTLVPDVSKPRLKQALPFREACNKIIHADRVDFFPHTHSEGPALTARVRLSGAKGNKEWLANLDVFAFIQSAFRIS